jgi:protease II
VHKGRQEVAGVPQFDSNTYTCHRTLAPEENGPGVPITLVHSKGLRLDGQNPTLALVYGSYGECLDISFAVPYTCLLRRGWVLAFCHVRGGGELGSAWHAAAGPSLKQRSVDDYEVSDAIGLLCCLFLTRDTRTQTCLRHLVATGYTSPARLCAQGMSAGALVVGALCNQKPHLLAAAILQVPFVDMLGTMCDPSLPLTVHERDEWGDPLADSAAFVAIKAVCPYTNVHATGYPPMFMSAARHDGRVPFWHPLKYAARIREVSTSGAPVLLKIDLKGDHYHATFDDIAEQYAFLHRVLGLAEV